MREVLFFPRVRSLLIPCSYLSRNEEREMGIGGNLWHSVKVGEGMIHWVPPFPFFPGYISDSAWVSETLKPICATRIAYRSPLQWILVGLQHPYTWVRIDDKFDFCMGKFNSFISFIKTGNKTKSIKVFHASTAHLMVLNDVKWKIS